MVRIIGIEIPDNKKMPIALSYIYGIGRPSALKILKALEIDGSRYAKDLTDDERDKVKAYVEKHFKIEGKLREEVLFNIKRLKDIKCYRGIKHIKGLPVRGQHTRTNTRTVRGNVRRTVSTAKRPPPTSK